MFIFQPQRGGNQISGQDHRVLPMELWAHGPLAASAEFLVSIQQSDLYPVISPSLSLHTKNGAEVLSRWQSTMDGQGARTTEAT